jgi:hypothetical protein
MVPATSHYYNYSIGGEIAVHLDLIAEKDTTMWKSSHIILYQYDSEIGTIHRS